MFIGFHLGQDGFDFLIRGDDEGGAFGAHVGFSVHAFFDPDAVCGDDFLVLVAEDGEWEAVFADEFFVAFDGVDADAEDGGFG